MCHPDWFNEANANMGKLMEGLFTSLGHIAAHVLKEEGVEETTLQKLMAFQVEIYRKKHPFQIFKCFNCSAYIVDC